MRLSTSNRYNSYHKAQVLVTTVHCDCGHHIEYDGTAMEAEKQIRARGATIGTTGIVRCKDCTQAYSRTVADALTRYRNAGL